MGSWQGIKDSELVELKHNFTAWEPVGQMQVFSSFIFWKVEENLHPHTSGTCGAGHKDHLDGKTRFGT